MPTNEVWYRVEDRRYASCDEWENVTIHTELSVSEYPVIKHTPKGVWLNLRLFSFEGESPRKRFVKRDVRKRFACPTLKEAYESFIARKERQAKIYEARASDTRNLIGQALFKIARFKDE